MAFLSRGLGRPGLAADVRRQATTEEERRFLADASPAEADRS